MKIKYEIFHKWWEYFLVIWWGIFRPSDARLLSQNQITKEEVRDKYKNLILEMLRKGDKEKIEFFNNTVSERKKDEDERKKNIELKAHSLLGQTSIAITLFVALISLSSTQFIETPIFLRIIFWISVVIILIHFITVALHARNAVVLMGYLTPHLVDTLDPTIDESELLIGRIFANYYNSYLNNVKATYLLFSHWYFKFGIILIFLIGVVLPVLIMSESVSKPYEMKNKSTNEIKIYDRDSTRKILGSDTIITKSDSLEKRKF